MCMAAGVVCESGAGDDLGAGARGDHRVLSAVMRSTLGIDCLPAIHALIHSKLREVGTGRGLCAIDTSSSSRRRHQPADEISLLTISLSWRVSFLLEALMIAVVVVETA